MLCLRAVGKESKKLKKVIKRVAWADQVGWALTVCWEHSSREEATYFGFSKEPIRRGDGDDNTLRGNEKDESNRIV